MSKRIEGWLLRGSNIAYLTRGRSKVICHSIEGANEEAIEYHDMGWRDLEMVEVEIIVSDNVRKIANPSTPPLSWVLRKLRELFHGENKAEKPA